ncbi:phosphopantetheine-binding protein [Desulfovibrio desulfuricans]|uniref:phosphopantetheine-binding protein n=1 Tax=Desulfovibrio desulfuricans TaxID=876 RepID=UPI0003B4513B|nr:phosphopantetheine-binding protein [Desulfovibrio desulfuricans]
MLEQKKFFATLQDILQTDTPITPDTKLTGMEEWDSLSIMSCIALFDKELGVKTRFSQYKDVNTVADLMSLGEGKIE